MIKIKSYICVLLSALTLIAGGTSCSDDYAQPPVQIPGGEDTPVGDGSWQNPLQVWQVHLGTTVDGRESNWVCGYIVGSVNRSYPSYSEASADFGVPTANYNTIILAQYPYDEADWAARGYTWENCVPVQLPSGVVRKALQLDANPNNFNRMVSIRGITGNKYLGAYALKQAADYKWGDQGKYEEPITEIGSEYFCNFTTSLDINYYIERGWSNLMQRGGLDGWTIGDNNGTRYANCSSYYGSEFGGPYINWLITPAFDLDRAKEKTLSFRSRTAYEREGSGLEVFLLTAQNPQGCDPVRLECVIGAPGESGYGEWKQSGVISLEEFSGVVYIGFRFTSRHGGSSSQFECNVTDINLGGANPDDWNIVDPASIGEFKSAPELGLGGKFAIVYDSKVMLPLAEDYTYGYINVADVTITDGVFSSSKDNAFTFISEDGGYVIKDCYDRYVYLDDTHPSFQVSYEKPATNYIWAIDRLANGNWKITNVGRNVCIDYAANYGNLSTVAASGYNGLGFSFYRLSE